MRLNPAFATLLGPDAAATWDEAAKDLLGRASLTAADVVDGLSSLAEVQSRQIVPVPGRDSQVKAGEDKLVCAGALFHLAFLGQAVMEDLRHLKRAGQSGFY